MMTAHLRPYQLADMAASLKIFNSNVPDYFHADELPLFAECLTGGTYMPPRLVNTGIEYGHFYVLEKDGEVLGCGGWYLDGDIANLSWGMISREHQRQGLGTALLQQRIQYIIQHGGARAVRIRTTSMIQLFYERNGFTVIGRNQTGLVDSMPLIELVKTL